jgi:hypothetical protein
LSTPEASLTRAATDLLLSAGAYFPFGQALHGYHHEDAIGALGVTCDF